MKKITLLFALALFIAAAWWLTARAAIPGPEVSVFLSPLAGPPDGAIQLLSYPSFEIPNDAWALFGDSEITFVDAHTGYFSLSQGGVDADGWAFQVFDISVCYPDSDVWVRAAYQIQTALPMPPLQVGFDISEGWFFNEGGISVVSLWQRYDYEYTEGWMDPWIRVVNLPEALDYGFGTIAIASMTNDDDTSRTDFLYDDVELWCVPKDPPEPYYVFLPAVSR